MAIAALPGYVRPRVLRGHARKLAGRLLSPAKPVLRNLCSIPFTVAGWGLLSAAAFELNTTLGLAVSGVILMLLERQIADEQ